MIWFISISQRVRYIISFFDTAMDTSKGKVLLISLLILSVMVFEVQSALKMVYILRTEVRTHHYKKHVEIYFGK